jgi:hypothetical protein
LNKKVVVLFWIFCRPKPANIEYTRMQKMV